MQAINKSSEKTLSVLGRQANIKASYSPDRALNLYINKFSCPMESLNILIVGLAFKGLPETDDIRGSCAFEFLKRIKDLVSSILWIDAVVPSIGEEFDNFKKKDFNYEVSDDIDAIFVLNNHPRNLDLRITNWLNSKKDKLLFDGWSQFAHARNLKEKSQFLYTTMGLMPKN